MDSEKYSMLEITGNISLFVFVRYLYIHENIRHMEDELWQCFCVEFLLYDTCVLCVEGYSKVFSHSTLSSL